MNTQPLSIAALQNALSAERLHAYALPTDSDAIDSVARYLWNMALGASLQPALHALEVTLRNHLYSHSERLIRGAGNAPVPPCWLDSSPTLLQFQEAESVRKAKEELMRIGRPLTPGRLVSKLGFGFWISLCKRPYEQGRASGPAIWPAILTHGFPSLPRTNRTRSFIFNALEPIRTIRNRVSHHEPIWDHSMIAIETQVLTTLGWMNPSLADAIRSESVLPLEMQKGYSAYLPLAERVIRL